MQLLTVLQKGDRQSDKSHGYRPWQTEYQGVNCVCPGDTDTPLLRGEAHQLGIQEEEFLKSSAVGRPLERLGTPGDIANAVLFSQVIFLVGLPEVC